VAVAAAASDGLVVEALTQVEMLLVMPRNHPLARKGRVRLVDLNGQQLVVPHQDRPHRIALDEALRRAGVEWTVAVEASGWELMVHFVELGLGLAIVNGCTRIPATLVGRPIPELVPVEYRLVRGRGSEDHPGAAELLRQLRSHGSDWRR
jgi:DNA-binding transcriptional LysR family regulator